tara:strand:+ start:422 stop:781 length:360 start_codon:yes stop_codon:yes gene_type:complete
MASRRYNFSNVVNNSNEMYRKYIYETRGLSRGLVHFRTQTFSYPSQEELATLTTTRYTWKVGDRFSKIAYEYYGDVELWWVIAMFNRSPTEAFVKKGDIIYIPQPVERAISMFRPRQEY